MEVYLDCGGGISGDMTLAALAHLGVDFFPLTAALEKAGVACQLELRDEVRAAGPGRRADVHWRQEAQPLRHPADIAAIFKSVDVPCPVRDRALAVLDALTQAEAYAHQIPPEQVHFHEVGAVDTLVDILGVCYGLEQLGVRRITASFLPWFSGSIECAHGRIPLPAPATAWLLQGKPVYETDARQELITPTGAALLHALVDEFTGAPRGTLAAMGTGFGSRPAASGLRIWLLQTPTLADHRHGGRELVSQLETHLDHLTGEELGQALTALAHMPEVLDVLWLPGTGKKNRPSGLLRVLCLVEHEDVAEHAVLRHTHTLGIRRQRLERLVSPRSAATVQIAGHHMPAKQYEVEGRSYVRPEADAVAQAAHEDGLGAPALRLISR
ncbi:MAG: LarC family nickel insertion protein [Desulfovibrio sp.]|nr:LarC family nickel insertion protein [Desulfovibrio sp.]